MRRHHKTFADYIDMFRKASVSIKAYAVDDYHPKVVGKLLGRPCKLLA